MFRTYAWKFARVSFAYIVLAKAGLMFAIVGSTVTLIWVPSGIALAGVLIDGPWMLLAVAMSAFWVNASTDVSLFAALTIALGNTLEAAASAAVAKRFSGLTGRLDSLRSVFALVGAACSATLIAALVGATTLIAAGGEDQADFRNIVLSWWLGDMMGILIAAPLMLLVSGGRVRWPTLREVVEMSCLLALLGTVGFTIFGAPSLAARGIYIVSLAVFPFVIWGALRFELWGATLVSLAVSVLAIMGSYRGTGPFSGGNPVDALERWCAFGSVTAVTGLLVAAVAAERRHAQEVLQSTNAELEKRVQERTHELELASETLRREMADNRRLEMEMLRLSEAQQQDLGRELHDGLGQLFTSLSLMCASLQQSVMTANDQQRHANSLQRMANLLSEGASTVRRISHGLYPVAMEFGGLDSALLQLAENSRALPGLDCVFRNDAAMEIVDSVIALNLYRIAQEAVSNAIKYSSSKFITIDLEDTDDYHRLTIRDDGIGIDPEQLSHSQGLGMASMRFRASLLGGEIDIGRNQPRGTCVIVTYRTIEVELENH